MGSVNKVILLGNLGADPQIRYMDNGTAKATFSLATNEIYKNKDGERVTQTEWHNVVLWRGIAETAEKYLRKGDQVYIEGKITYRSYDDKEGNKKYITEVVGREMSLLSNRRDADQLGGESVSNNKTEGTHTADMSGSEDDELPF